MARGSEAAGLEPLLFGPHKRGVARYRPPATLCEAFTFDEPATEPFELEPVLALLAERLASQLADWVAGRLTIKVALGGLETSAARRAKEPLGDAKAITRLAALALGDTGAAVLGVETVTVELAGLYRPAEQGASSPCGGLRTKRSPP